MEKRDSEYFKLIKDLIDLRKDIEKLEEDALKTIALMKFAEKEN